MSHKPAWLVEADSLAPSRDFVVVVRPDHDDVNTEFHGRNRAQRRAVWSKASARQRVGGTPMTPEERRVDKALKAEAAMVAGRRGRRITTVGDDGVTVVTYAPVKGAKPTVTEVDECAAPEAPPQETPTQNGRIRKAFKTIRRTARPAA